MKVYGIVDMDLFGYGYINEVFFNKNNWDLLSKRGKNFFFEVI